MNTSSVVCIYKSVLKKNQGLVVLYESVDKYGIGVFDPIYKEGIILDLKK